MKKILDLLNTGILVMTIVIITGCNNKNTINSKEFSSIMKEKGYTVNNITKNYSDFNYLKEALTVVNNNNWQLDFYILDSEEHAKNLYNNNIKTFKYMKNENSKEEYTVKSSRYNIIFDDNYGVVAMNKNTMIYVNASKDYKNEIDIILEDIGY